MFLLNDIDSMAFDEYNKREKYNLYTGGARREDELQEIMDNAR